MTADQILAYEGNSNLALGGSEAKGIAPGAPQFANAIPAWLNVANQELAMREAQYKRHLKEIDDARLKAERDTTFDYSKARPGDIQGFVDEGQKIKEEAYANAVKIVNEPNSKEALKINSDIAHHLATVNQSAQANAMVTKAIDKSNLNPDAFENIDEEIKYWNSLPPDQAAQYIPKINSNITFDLNTINNEIKKTAGLDVVKGEFIGKDATTGMWKFSDNTEFNPQSLNTAIENAWTATVGKTGRTREQIANKIYNNSTDDEKLAMINAFLSPEEKVAEGLDKTLLKDLTDDQKSALIQKYAPDAHTEFTNQALAATAGKKAATQWRNDAYALAQMNFDFYKQKTDYAKPLGGEAIDAGLELLNANSPRYTVDKGAEGKFAEPPSLFYSVNGQTIDGFVNKDGNLYAIPKNGMKDYKAEKKYGKGYFKLTKDEQAEIDKNTVKEWDANTLIPINDYYAQVYTPYIDVLYGVSGGKAKEGGQVYASQVDKNNILKFPQPQGKAYEQKVPIGTSTSSGSFQKGNVKPIPKTVKIAGSDYNVTGSKDVNGVIFYKLSDGRWVDSSKL